MWELRERRRPKVIQGRVVGEAIHICAPTTDSHLFRSMRGRSAVAAESDGLAVDPTRRRPFHQTGATFSLLHLWRVIFGPSEDTHPGQRANSSVPPASFGCPRCLQFYSIS